MQIILTPEEVKAEIHEGNRLKLAKSRLNGGMFDIYTLSKRDDGAEVYNFDTYRPVARRAPEVADRSERERNGRSYAELLRSHL